MGWRRNGQQTGQGCPGQGGRNKTAAFNIFHALFPEKKGVERG
jgi:hypothetical protein